jgi:hypothetical protein
VGVGKECSGVGTYGGHGVVPVGSGNEKSPFPGLGPVGVPATGGGLHMVSAVFGSGGGRCGLNGISNCPGRETPIGITGLKNPGSIGTVSG